MKGALQFSSFPLVILAWLISSAVVSTVREQPRLRTRILPPNLDQKKMGVTLGSPKIKSLPLDEHLSGVNVDEQPLLLQPIAELHLVSEGFYSQSFLFWSPVWKDLRRETVWVQDQGVGKDRPWSRLAAPLPPCGSRSGCWGTRGCSPWPGGSDLGCTWSVRSLSCWSSRFSRCSVFPGCGEALPSPSLPSWSTAAPAQKGMYSPFLKPLENSLAFQCKVWSLNSVHCSHTQGVLQISAEWSMKPKMLLLKFSHGQNGRIMDTLFGMYHTHILFMYCPHSSSENVVKNSILWIQTPACLTVPPILVVFSTFQTILKFYMEI